MQAVKKIFAKILWCFHDFTFYKLIALLGLIVRIAILPLVCPDIFELIFSFLYSSWGLPQWAYEVIIRICLFIIDVLGFNNIFYFLSFLSTGNSYKSGSAPWWGSICYTLYFVAYNVIPIILYLYFQWKIILIVFSAYIAFCAIIYGLSYCFLTLPDIWVIRIVIHSICTAIIFIILITVNLCCF